MNKEQSSTIKTSDSTEYKELLNQYEELQGKYADLLQKYELLMGLHNYVKMTLESPLFQIPGIPEEDRLYKNTDNQIYKKHNEEIKQPAMKDLVVIKPCEEAYRLDETTASCVGDRIRKIRNEKGLSRTELGEKVGLDANRIQQYENGRRKPKADLLKQIAGALGVSTFALADPNITSCIGAMYTFFELEQKFNMKIEEGAEDKPASMVLSVSFKDPIYDYMKEWLEEYKNIQAQLDVASSDEERKEILKSYHNWQWNYPNGVVGETEKALQKARIKNKIEELQEIYDKLNGKLD